MMYSAVRIASATIVRVELTGAGPTKLLPPHHEQGGTAVDRAETVDHAVPGTVAHAARAHVVAPGVEALHGIQLGVPRPRRHRDAVKELTAKLVGRPVEVREIVVDVGVGAMRRSRSNSPRSWPERVWFWRSGGSW